MPIQGVIFDLDDTLYPELSYVASGFRAVDRYLSGAGACEFGEFFCAAKSWFEAGPRSRVFDNTVEAMGISLDRFPISELVRVYREHSPAIRLFPDAEDWLIGNQGNYLLGIITDGFAISQRRKVIALEIENRISSIVYSDDFGRTFWKPHSRPYLEIQSRLGLRPEALVYVGDNPTKDFKGAREAGWHSIRIRRHGTLHQLVEPMPGFEPDLEISIFDELNAALINIPSLLNE
jgi:putative hydrolase of the HAD superfamily